MSEWKRVVFSAECDEDGNCPVCGEDFGECGCPGPTMDDYEYKVVKGVLYGRPEKESLEPCTPTAKSS